jgi:hypothetical protein
LPQLRKPGGVICGMIQSDQIGRIFAQWVVVYFGLFFEIFRSSPHFWASFFHSQGYALILAKMYLATFLGDTYY